MKTLIKKVCVVFVFTLVLALGLYNLYTPTFQSGFKLAQEDAVDSMLLAYFHEHMYRYFFDASYTAKFYAATFFYPSKNSMVLSDINLGVAPIYWFYRNFFDALTSYQLLPITVLALTYIGFVFLLKYLNVNWYIAILSSYVFVFGMPRIHQLGHGQLMNQIYMPWAFMYLIKFIKKPTLTKLNIFIALVYLNTLAGFYIGWFFILSLMILLFVLPVFLRSYMPGIVNLLVIKKNLVIVSLGTWITLFGLFWGPYFLAANNFWYWSTVLIQLPTVGYWFLAPEGSLYNKLLLHSNSYIPVISEKYLFPGIYVLFVLFLLFKNYKKLKDFCFSNSLLKTTFIVFLVLTLLSLRIGNYSLWYVVYGLIPGANAIRAVARIWLVSNFYLLIAGSLLLQHLVTAYYKDLRRFFPVILLLYIFFITEQLVPIKKSFVKKDFLVEVKNLESVIPQDCDLLYVETEKKEYVVAEDNVIAMWASLNRNVLTINGYSSVTPKYLFSDHDADFIISELIPKDFTGNLCVIDKEHGANTYRERKLIHVEK